MGAHQGEYNLSAHGVFVEDHKILQLKANYGNFGWGLPGGKIDLGETIHQAVARECVEELGVDCEIGALTGVYYHKVFHSHVFIFRCYLPPAYRIVLSDEHTEFRFFSREELSLVQRHRVDDCLNYQGLVSSYAF